MKKLSKEEKARLEEHCVEATLDFLAISYQSITEGDEFGFEVFGYEGESEIICHITPYLCDDGKVAVYIRDREEGKIIRRVLIDFGDVPQDDYAIYAPLHAEVAEEEEEEETVVVFPSRDGMYNPLYSIKIPKSELYQRVRTELLPDESLNVVYCTVKTPVHISPQSNIRTENVLFFEAPLHTEDL